MVCRKKSRVVHDRVLFFSGIEKCQKDDNIKKGYINGRYSTIPLKGSSLIEVLGGE